MANLKFALFLLYNGIGLVFGASLLSGPRCGSKICPFLDYCSELTNNCDHCSAICDERTHNFDESTCKEHCQDYLRDARYLNSGSPDDGTLKGTVLSLSRLVTGTLTIVCFLVVILSCLLIFQLYRWKKKKNITLESIKKKFFKSKAESNEVKTMSTPVKENKRADLRLEVNPTTPGTQSGHSPVTVSTTISRKPAEDSTLDYAYDNHGMADTPSPR